MATPFLSEIKLVAFTFAPRGWALCNGQLLPINQNQALFSLLGTNYGGNGQTNFSLPDLRGRTPIHMGGSHVIGERGGEFAHTLTAAELPKHKHQVRYSTNPATTDAPAGNAPGKTVSPVYGASQLVSVAMAPGVIGNTGGSQPHANMPPYLVLNFCIALQGVFPSQN